MKFRVISIPGLVMAILLNQLISGDTNVSTLKMAFIIVFFQKKMKDA